MYQNRFLYCPILFKRSFAYLAEGKPLEIDPLNETFELPDGSLVKLDHHGPEKGYAILRDAERQRPTATFCLPGPAIDGLHAKLHKLIVTLHFGSCKMFV